MRTIFGDLRLALRTLLRSPWLAATAVLTLALGLGCVAAMLSVIKGVVLRPFPYSEPAEIVMIWNRWQDFPKTWVSLPEFRVYREQTKSFADVAMFYTEGVNLSGQGEAQRVNAGFVSPNIFHLLGVSPVLGRTFTWEEAKPGRTDVVVLGQGLWQRQYGGDRGVIGSSIEINGTPKTVVGIMPAGFRLPLDFSTQEPPEIWLPQAIDLSGPATLPYGGGDHNYFTVGRLRPGVTAESAAAELRALADRYTTQGVYPQTWHFSPLVIPLVDDVLGSTRWALAVLLVAVALVLLIACANVALLLLARGNQRRRELALRAALGARRWSLIRHLLMESVALAVLGWLAGLLLAQVALAQLVRTVGPNIPRIGEVTLDPGIMLAMALVSVITALLVGLPPSLHHSVVDPQLELKEGGRTPGLSAGQRRSQALLVAAEMALAMVLVVGTGLMVRSFWNLLRVDVGFHAQNVLTMAVSPSLLREADGGRVPRFYQALLARLAEVPSVERAAAVRSLPLASAMGDWGISVEGYQPPARERVAAEWQAVTPGYFEIMGIPLKAGRTFRESDTEDSQPVIVVNETLAKRFWPNQDPLGKRIRVTGAENPPWSTVVGVVGDVRHSGVTSEVKEQFYLPNTQFHVSTGFAIPAMTLVVKTSVPPARLINPIRQAVLGFDAKLPVANAQDMEQVLAQAISQPRITMLLMILAAVLAIVLAVVGAYGVVGYGVSNRTREIGLRIALGAEPRKVMRMIVGQGLTSVVLGIVLGGVTAVIVMRFLASLLFGVTVHDPVIYLSGALLLLLVAAGASFLPAWRASRIDPAIALRGQ